MTCFLLLTMPYKSNLCRKVLFLLKCNTVPKSKPFEHFCISHWHSINDNRFYLHFWNVINVPLIAVTWYNNCTKSEGCILRLRDKRQDLQVRGWTHLISLKTFLFRLCPLQLLTLWKFRETWKNVKKGINLNVYSYRWFICLNINSPQVPCIDR